MNPTQSICPLGADLSPGQAFKHSAGWMSLGNLRQVRAAPLSAQSVNPPIFSEMLPSLLSIKWRLHLQCCYQTKWTMCEGFTLQIVSLGGILSELVLAVDSFINSDKSSLHYIALQLVCNALLPCKIVLTNKHKWRQMRTNEVNWGQWVKWTWSTHLAYV